MAALHERHVQASLLSPPQIVQVQRARLNVMADLSDLDAPRTVPLVERFMKAYIDEIKFHRSQPDAVIAYLRKFSWQNDAELKLVYEDLRKRIREETVPTTGGIQTIIKTLKTNKGKQLDPRRIIDFFPAASAK